MSNHKFEENTLSESQVMELLAADTRRAALSVLQENPETSLDHLADAVAGNPATDLDHPDRVSLRLHHTDLPTLDSAGVLDYDIDGQSVDYIGNDVVETVLDALDQ